jgi:predicted GH43/DUF377 family glycosyl hydrolase
MIFTDNTCGTHKAKDPAVVYLHGRYYMYYSRFAENGSLRLGIAVSCDGDEWRIHGELPLTQDCEKNGIGAPGAVVLNGKVHLFYQTYGNGVRDAICHAVSGNGIDFIKDEANPVFAPRAGSWSCGRAIDADVCVFGDKLYLYYATRDPQMKIQMVGCAAAPLGSAYTRGDFTEAFDGAILKPELPWEGECIEAPAAIARGGRVYMFYGGSYNCTPQQIGCAVSDDGVHFTRVSLMPFLPNGAPGEWNASESGHPYVFEDIDGEVYLYYQGSADNGRSWYLSRKKISLPI